jgi:protein gp37
MAEKSGISWTDASFSPWWGCVKVSPACTRCYAESASKRFGHSVWGPDSSRRFFGEKHWKEPVGWDERARRAKKRTRVFCAPMADIFEKRDDLVPWRKRLWELVRVTPNLDWLLLTKRSENILDMTPDAYRKAWPENAWAGVTAENQEWAEKRIPDLLNVPAKVRWLSVEPMLGPVDLTKWLGPDKVNWVIVGGESGHGARPMEASWVTDVLGQCRKAGVGFFFKQKGAAMARTMHCASEKGDDPSEWPDEFKVQESPKVA